MLCGTYSPSQPTFSLMSAAKNSRASSMIDAGVRVVKALGAILLPDALAGRSSSATMDCFVAVARLPFNVSLPFSRCSRPGCSATWGGQGRARSSVAS